MSQCSPPPPSNYLALNTINHCQCWYEELSEHTRIQISSLIYTKNLSCRKQETALPCQKMYLQKSQINKHEENIIFRLLPNFVETVKSQFPPDSSGLILFISKLLPFLLAVSPHFLFNNLLVESQIGCTGKHTLLLLLKLTENLQKPCLFKVSLVFQFF